MITGGTAAGHNLFHSFGDFNVGASDSARFQTGLVNPLPDASVSNILARVTGGQSNLYGNLDSATYYPSANLFLMNPAGFLFGQNATVNVGGMMTFTTADSMKMRGLDGSNAGIFHADIAQTNILTSAPVAAFGFIGSNPHSIDFIGGQLTVASGTGLALVGGGINLLPDSSGTPSSITDPGRPIHMTSVAGPGEVAADRGIPAVGMALGTVTLGQGTTLDTSYNSGASLIGDGSGGAISIRGGQFVATGATLLTNPDLSSTGQGGAVTITASGTASLAEGSSIDTSLNSPTNGDAGAVSIVASQVSLQDSFIQAHYTGDVSTAGAGGAVTLTGTDSVTLTRAFVSTDSFFSNGGAVSLTAPTVVLEESFVFTGTFGRGNGGAVTLGDSGTSSVSMTRSGIATDTSKTTGNSGPVTINGSTVTIIDNFFGSPSISTNTQNNVGDPNAGNGGDIVITGTNVTFSDFAQIQSVAASPGTFSKGGTIRITGSESILIENGTGFRTTVTSQGSAGDIQLESKHVTISGQSVLSSETFGPASGGIIKIAGTEDIVIRSGSLITTNSANSGEAIQGPAGHVELDTQQLTISGGSIVQSQTTGTGLGGTVTVQGIGGPAQSVLISDADSGIFTDTRSFTQDGNLLGTGTGGNIFVNANSVTLQNGGTLSAATTGAGHAGSILVKADSVSITSGSLLRSSSSLRQTLLFDGEAVPLPTGNAGTVTIQGLASPAQSVRIDGPDSGIFTDTRGTGAGGNILVNANTIAMTNGSSVSASSTGPGDTGNIHIDAGNQFTMTNSSVTTEANHASGGAIKITTDPGGTVRLTNNSMISASVLDGTGGGGSVNIDPQFVILLNSQILAQAKQGPGGNISITTNFLLPDANSVISASSQFGVNGTITIQSPNAPISGHIQPLGKTPLIATSLFNQRCASLAGGEFSSFTVAGRDSLPIEPGSWLASPLATPQAQG